MKGTSEARWCRNTSSVATSLSATRPRKREAGGGSGRRRRSTSGISGFTRLVPRLSERLHGREVLDLHQPTVGEAVDLAQLEVPPGGLVAVGEGDVVDAVGLARLAVDALLVAGAQRGEEGAQAGEEGGVVQGHGHGHRGALANAAGDVGARQLLHPV